MKKYRSDIKIVIYEWYLKEKELVQKKVEAEWKLLVKIAKVTGNLSIMKDLPPQETIKYTKDRNDTLRQK